ncbi:zinc-alpha-2-glycoprotein-like [Cebus imitator]|uniref:zinc-alpha-2-glycoprotein-like n=1 Tax=Cebus imitator TaxID=2715852 RepID=UPI0008099E81|nr:zinc-alpha-2-glycoprotein-like [Cebus imitator]
MVKMVPILLSLPLLLGPAVPQGTQDGHYSLTYLYTGLSRPSKGIHRLQGTVFLNDQAFFRYDSEDGKAEPLGPWRHVEGVEDWEKQSQFQKAREEFFLETLKEIMQYYNNSNGEVSGIHTLQERFGCKIQNNRSTEAFWKNAYDGKDYIEFNKEIPAWVPLVPEAQNTKQKWEAEPVYVLRAKAYLEGECPAALRKYLNYSKSILDRQAPPSVVVTSHQAPGENKKLKCLAYDFYPREIDVHWTRAGKVQEPDSGGDVLCSGNGTYLTWVVVHVSPKDTAPYSCYVQHSSLAQPLVVPGDAS